MAATTLLTSDQFLALPEEFDRWGNRIRDELVGGEIVVEPMRGIRHSIVQAEIGSRQIEFLAANPQLQLRCLFSLGAQTGKMDAFAPDLCVTSRLRLAQTVDFFQGAPELAIEVVSAADTARHLKRKVDIHLQNGPMSVSVVYPESRSVVGYRGDSIHELRADQPVSAPLLPGFSSPVSAFFALT